MFRGTQKQMVVVRTAGSRFYEQAYFVLRDGQLPDGTPETTMMAEANRILDESQLMPQPRRRVRRGKGFLLFFGGALAGALLCAAAFLLFAF